MNVTSINTSMQSHSAAPMAKRQAMQKGTLHFGATKNELELFKTAVLEKQVAEKLKKIAESIGLQKTEKEAFWSLKPPTAEKVAKKIENLIKKGKVTEAFELFVKRIGEKLNSDGTAAVTKEADLYF